MIADRTWATLVVFATDPNRPLTERVREALLNQIGWLDEPEDVAARQRIIQTYAKDQEWRA